MTTVFFPPLHTPKIQLDAIVYGISLNMCVFCFSWDLLEPTSPAAAGGKCLDLKGSKYWLEPEQTNMVLPHLL